MDKRDRALLFRQRLGEAMTLGGETRAGLARRVGVDRSTISQLLAGEALRLPNAQVVAECAGALGVSGDWLLGLSDLPERASEALAASMQASEANRAPFDDQIFDWHREATGYKIRHVPATLPDILKTEALLRWEYAPHMGRTIEQAVGASRDRLEWMRQSLSDYEIAMPLFAVDSFVTATGYYRSLPDDIRAEQIAHMLALHDQLYPSLRIFLFDARRLWSGSMTIFGPLVGVIYLGQEYLAFRDRARVRQLTRGFDVLVREASVSARDWPGHLEQSVRDARRG
ncbi:MAG: helix-turn-helix domain-containing protein [Silicimonas sp.]|nr:helix-turn-helix domain-containing protein [Silicimonas sp.]